MFSGGWKGNIVQTNSDVRTCVDQGIRNINNLEDFANVLNKWTLNWFTVYWENYLRN